MSRFSGPQHKGAMRVVRETKRMEAEARDAALPLNDPRRRRNRLDPTTRLLTAIFGGAA